LSIISHYFLHPLTDLNKTSHAEAMQLLHRTSIIALIFTIMTLAAGCAGVSIAEPPVKEPLSQLYRADFDQIWRNIQLAMRRYPVRVNNIDAGILETDYIKADKLFSMPSETPPRPGVRYKIIVRGIKGSVEGKPAVEVKLQKIVEMQENFFEGFRTVPSDGLEEQTILYRIGRYLEIDQMLGKTQTPATAPSPKK
jgi:hypothetical protein